MTDTTQASEPVDALIVGSGFGGAVTALRLAECGHHAVLLERGKSWPITKDFNTFSSLQNPDGRSSWLSPFSVLGQPKPIDPFIGVLELSLENGIAAFAGAGLGGGSLVYAAVLYQPTRTLFRSIFGSTVSYSEMDEKYYPRVRAELRPAPIPPAILHHPYYSTARAWLALGEMAGLRARRLDMGIDWDIVALELFGKRPESVVTGDFWYGNNSGAKRSLDQNYLRKAQQLQKLDVLTQHVATDIERTAEGRYRVTAVQIDEHGVEQSRRQFVAKKLFLGAGSLGTSKLLVRARERGLLPQLNAEVGRHWGNNGDFFGGLTGLSDRVRTGKGGTAPIGIEDHDNELAPVTLECYGDWARQDTHGEVSSVGVSVVPALGEFHYNAAKDDVELTWPAKDPAIARVLEAANASYAKLGKATPHGIEAVTRLRECRGGLRAHALPSQSFNFSKPRSKSVEPRPTADTATAHPLGGVVLNRATDNIGTVLNYPGMYVMDGALIPGHAGCTNPALTIAALAERNIERILERDF